MILSFIVPIAKSHIMNNAGKKPDMGAKYISARGAPCSDGPKLKFSLRN
jgi:hypothetical protein